jgi:phage terminase Nu1 subunit (DNA packaging protein)
MATRRKKWAAGVARKPHPKLVTRREVAAALDVHMGTVTLWERGGLPIAKRGGRGRPSLYDPTVVQHWLAERDGAARKAAEGTGPTQGTLAARAERDHWQAQVARQNYETKQGLLVPAADVERVWSAEVAGWKAKILSQPTAWADRLFRAATLEGLAGVERVAREMATELLREFAGRRPEEPAA